LVNVLNIEPEGELKLLRRTNKFGQEKS